MTAEPAPLETWEAQIAGGWRLEVQPTAMRLTKPGEAQQYELPRATVLEAIERIGLEYDRPFFVVRAPKRRIFRLDRQDALRLAAWLGDDFGPELRNQLDHRIKNALPFAALYIISNPHDPFAWALAVVMAAQGLLGRYRPSHWIFLFQVIFWAIILGRDIDRILESATGATGMRVFFVILWGLFFLFSISFFLRFHAVWKRHRARGAV